ncbi:MAG: universal stress protein [Dehalococcoidia bacterium]
MYQNILVPLDGSKESEGVLPMIQDLPSLDGRLLLLRVIPPGEPVRSGQHTIMASEQEEGERARALAYLKGLARQPGRLPDQLDCKVIVSRSVASAIVECAARENVDLIVMYTHGRRSLTRLLMGSRASQVQRRAPMEVRVITQGDLVEGQTLTY